MKKSKDITVEDVLDYVMPEGVDGGFLLDDSFMEPIFYDTPEKKEKYEKD